MLFKITRNGDPILLDEWDSLIEVLPYLESMPDKESVNPFTDEKIVFPGIGKALHKEDGEGVGNASLESGEILTSGIPFDKCKEMADSLHAVVLDDDRS